MDTTLTHITPMAEQNKRIAEAVSRERSRLRNFIRQRVSDPGDAEDILQDVFYEFVAAYRLPEPIEQVGAWLYRVALNRIIDRFRKHKSEVVSELPDETDDEPWLENVLPSLEAGPEAAYARRVLMAEINAALDVLPELQRSVFVAHELEGRSFREMSEESSTPINTLLARKRYAVKHLQARLQTIYEEFNL